MKKIFSTIVLGIIILASYAQLPKVWQTNKHLNKTLINGSPITSLVSNDIEHITQDYERRIIRYDKKDGSSETFKIIKIRENIYYYAGVLYICEDNHGKSCLIGFSPKNKAVHGIDAPWVEVIEIIYEGSSVDTFEANDTELLKEIKLNPKAYQ